MRAIAISSVLLFHAFPSFLSGGFVGVDVFFVISGYLISSIIFRGLSQNTFSFFDFYARRIRRIFPSVFVVLLITVFLGYWLLTPYEFRDLVSDLPYSAFFLENFHLYSTTGGYWDVATEKRPLMHFWSLGVEEQYYIIYPLLCYFLWRVKPKLFLSILLLLLCTSLAFCLYDTQYNAIRAFYSLHSRFWELLVGGVLAYLEILGLKKSITVSKANVLSFIGFALVSSAIVFFNEGKGFPGWRALLPTLGTVLIIAAGKEAFLNKYILSHKAVVFVGLISYPLYLWHWPLITLVRNNIEGHLPTGTLMLSILTASVLLAYFTYTFVERPIRQCKANLPLISILVIVMSALVIGVFQYEKSTRNERLLSNGITSLISSESKGLWKQDKECSVMFGKNHTVCHSKGKSPSVLVTGDSHAYWYWNAIKESKLDVLLVANAGGSIFENSVKKGRHTLKQTEQIWNQIRHNDQIQTVVLMGYWSSYLTSMKYNEYPTLSKKSAFIKSWENALQELTALKKNVVVLVDSPLASFDPKDRCYSLRKFVFYERDINSCSVSRRDLEKENQWIRDFFKSLAKRWPNVIFVDSWDGLCDEHNCYFAQGNELYYRDEGHLTTHGVRKVWPLVESVLEKKIQ